MKKIYILILIIAGSQLLFSVLPGFSPCLYAQETSGGLRGKVLDGTGQPLAGATVIAIHEPSGTQYATAAGADGRYNLPGLRIGGPYTVKVNFIGQAPQTRNNLQISLGEPLTLNFALTDNSRQLSAVVVKATRGSQKANAYGAGQNISRTAIRNMPTISRSLQDQTRAVPQASKDNSFVGTSFRYNNVTVDGAINNDAIGFSPSLGGVTGTSGQPGSSTRTNPISIDAIQDLQVYLAPYDVKIGNFTGGSINAVTRSGTNNIEGSVYAYGRNAFLTRKRFPGVDEKLSNDFHDYQTGFRVGFPIIKNKLFFFTNEEITRRVDPIQQLPGSSEEHQVITLQQAKAIADTAKNRYGIDVGTFGKYNVYSRSNKFFNRLDWNINPRNQLVLRNNTIFSQAVNLERDQQDFRFASIAYQQVNNQVTTVAELRTRINNNMSNNALVEYTAVHDYRNPLSDPTIPQVQIVGNTPGSTIFFGTDREAAIFNQKQHTLEISDNFTWNLGKHTVLFGTHNELYRISYGFVNSWNGRIDYPSIGAFLLPDNQPLGATVGGPSRIRVNYNFANNDRLAIFNHPTAVFSINFFSAYVQDEIQISDVFKVIPGLRMDYTDIPKKQATSKVSQSPYFKEDQYFGTTYTYTPLDKINQDYLGRLQAEPRLGASYDIFGDKTLIARGGLGLFTGRIPFAWLGYVFYNTGNTYGAFDQRYNTTGSNVGTLDGKSSPLQQNPGNPSSSRGYYYASQRGNVTDPNGSQTQVDAVDNKFTMPKVLRSSLGVDYTNEGWKYTLEGIYTKTIKDVKFQQINITDNPSYNAYDLVLQRQPIFPGSVNSQIANSYLLSNTSEGFRYTITGQISRHLQDFDFSGAYTFGVSKDISNGIRNSLESNWQLNQALNPNDPRLANSNFDIRNRIVVNATYHKTYGRYTTTASVFFQAQSGSPFTYGFVNYTPQGVGQQVALAYIPNRGEAINFFRDYYQGSDGQQYFDNQPVLSSGVPIIKVPVTAQQQADDFNAYVDNSTYLKTRRGNFTERNKGRTPWNTSADFHLQEDMALNVSKDVHHIFTITLDILNALNLIDKNWGKSYFVPNTYNSTASVGLVPYTPSLSSNGYPIYRFVNPGAPYSVDFFNSRYQMQLGVRYSF